MITGVVIHQEENGYKEKYILLTERNFWNNYYDIFHRITWDFRSSKTTVQS